MYQIRLISVCWVKHLSKTPNMKQLVIEGTKYSPRVELNPNGEIKLEGRSIIEDPIGFFNPIFRWIKSVNFNTLKVDIKMEYLNTGSLKQVYTLLTLIKENHCVKNIYVSWYYEEGDEDCYELGRDIESQIKLPFDFFEYEETAA
jgi:hypothetical protein